MNGNPDTTDEPKSEYSRAVDRLLSLAGVTAVAGGWLWNLRRELVVAAALLAAVVGLQVVPVVGLFAGGDATDATAMAAPSDQEWTFSTGNIVISSPTVVDGTVYIGDRGGTLHAVDASDGSQQWNFSAGNRVNPSPAAVDGTVYVPTYGKLYALDASDGSQQWNFSTNNYIHSSPTVADGTVYVGSYDDNLYAVDASDGSQQWNFSTGDDIFSSPTVVDGTVYVGSRDGNLYAVDASDGSQQWSFSTDGDIESSPTVVDGTVYVGSADNNLYAVDASDGSQQWNFLTNGWVRSSPTVADGTVYVGSYDDNLYAVNAFDGSQQWNFSTGDDVKSSPTVADGTVYVGSYDDNLYAVNAFDGSQQWNFSTGDDVKSSPTVADGTVYVGSYDDNLYAVDASDGSQQWSFSTNGNIESSPTVADGTVYVGSADNSVYALTASSSDTDSGGSRNMHGTLGHNGLFTADGSTIGGTSSSDTLSGTVTDADGKPIPDATVEADSGAATTTDSNGDYSLELDGGTYDVTYSADGFDPVTIEVDASSDTTQDVTLYKAGRGPRSHTIGVCYAGGAQFRASTATASWFETYVADGRFTKGNAPDYVRNTWGYMLDDGVYQSDTLYSSSNLHSRTEFDNRQNTTATDLVRAQKWNYDLRISTDRVYLKFDGVQPTASSSYTELEFNPPFETSGEAPVYNDGTEANCPETTAEAPLSFSWTPSDPQTNRSVRLAPDDATHDDYSWTIEKSDGTVERDVRVWTAFWTEPGSYDVTLTATVNGERMSNTETVDVTQAAGISDDDRSRDYQQAYHAAEFEYSPANPDVNQSVAFEANGSASADSYSWDIAGDASASGRSASYAFGAEDYHMVTLTATVNGIEASRYKFVKVGDGIPEAVGGGDREEGWGPTAMGPCTTLDGEGGVYIEYWDPDYETEELSYQLEEGDAYHEGTLTFDQPKGYVFTCVASDAYDPDNPEDTNATISDSNQTYDAGWSDRRGNEVAGAGGGGGGGFVPADAGADAPLWVTAIPAAAVVGWVVLRRRRGGSGGTGGSAGGGGGGGGSGGIGPF
jgi:outer membrane protein assembly factor BamB